MKHTDIDTKDCDAINSAELSREQAEDATERIAEFLPNYTAFAYVGLAELDMYLTLKYKAQKAYFKDIDKCTRTKIRKYNKYCKTVFCISEGLVSDDEYYSSYVIKRENRINPSIDEDDYFYDVFVIVGSNDGKSPTSYFIGGSSDGLSEEMYMLTHAIDRKIT